MTTAHGETSSRPACNADAVFIGVECAFATMSMATLQRKRFVPIPAVAVMPVDSSIVENDLSW